MLRKVVVEMPRGTLEETDYVSGLKRVETLKIIHLFKYDNSGYAGIVQVKLKSPSDHPRNLVGVAGMTKVSVLTKEKNGSYVIYGEGKPMDEWISRTLGSGGYRFPPFELTQGGWRITFIGSEDQASAFLSALEKLRFRYKVVMATEARFTAISFLSVLTDGQRRTLLKAYEMGYYDVPRRLGSEVLANSLGIGKSTVVEHLRKAEKRLLDEILQS